MQNLSNSKKLETATHMIYFLLNASKTTDRNVPLKDTTKFLKGVYELLTTIKIIK